MKSRLLLFSLVSSLPVSAADFQWDPNGATTGLGGAGTWNTTNLFWDATATGINDGTDATTATTFTTSDKAIFGGTGGAVSVGTAVSLNQLSVDTTGYSFTGSKITFGGTGATLTANADFTIANAIGGNFNKVGSGTVTLTGLTTFNTVTVSAGTLIRQASGDNDSSASVVNGGTLILASTAANSTSNVTLNSGTVRLNGTNDVQIWNGGTVTLNGGTFEQNGKNETVGSLVLNGGSITGLGTLTSGSVIDARSGSTATILAGTSGFTKTTAGTVTLTAANTYTGTTTISGGTLLVGNGGSTGSLGVGALVNNGTLTYNLVGASTVATLGSGGITGITGSGSTSITADTINFGASGGFTATTSGNQSYIATRNATTYPKGMVFGTSGAYNFTTTGGASITMKGDIGASAASSASVNLDTSSGNGAINLDISVGRSNQFYNIGSITANAGTGAINWTGTYGAVRGSDSSQSTPITLTGAINMTANFQSQTLQTLTLNATGSSTVTGNLLGTINLVKGGSQNLTLSGVNTFTGNVLVSAGELQTSATNNVRSLGADIAGRTVTVSSGATLKFLGSDTFGNAGSTPNPSLIISGTVTNVAGKLNTLSNVTLSGGLLTNLGGFSGAYQSYSLAGGVTVNGTSASSITTTGTTNTGVHLGTNTSFNVADATGSAAADLTVSVPLVNRNGDLGGAGGLTKSGAGTMTLSAINTYTGNTTVSAGALEVGGSGQLGSGAYAGGISNAGTLSINTSANQTLSGAITGAGSLVKDNTGTLTLSGNSSTYTGTTTVSAGTLLVSGQLGGDASVSSTATLAGGGTVGGNLSFLTGSLFDIASALTGDALSVGGTVTFGSSFGIDNLAGVTWGSVSNGIYTLIDTTGTDFSLAGLDNFGLANAYNLGGGRSAYFSQGSLQLVVIPEPSAALLGGLGLLVLLRRRRN